MGSTFGGRFTNSGYLIFVNNLAPIAGGYNLVVFSHSSVTGTFNNAQVVHVIVQ